MIQHKFGRNPRDFSKPALRLEDYVTASGLPAAPLCVDRASKVTSWPMYGNDSIGDCTIAAAGHMIQGWSAYANTEATIAQPDVITAYSAVSGYDPATGANDNGAQMSDVCAYWKNTGIGGHKIAGYAALGDPTDLTLLRQVLNTFGTVYVGINCPQSAQQEFGQIWEYDPASPIAGGHAISLQQTVTGQNGIFHFTTWGALQKATIAFVEHYVEEAWCVVSNDWITANGTSVEGLNLTQLLADMP